MPTDPKGSKKHWQASLRESSSFLTIGVQLAGSMLVYIFIGYFLDRWLDTTPWLLIAGAITGMFAFFIQLVRLVKRLSPPRKASDDEQDSES